MSQPPRVTVRQGGKEELRASLLKTYLLRLRAEKGERAVKTLLADAGVDPAVIDNETGWLSTQAAKRALRALGATMGMDALKRRGDWVTHPEALGTHVRMLRSAQKPIDAYRHVAQNAKELTRVGTWEMDDVPKEKEATATSVKMIYRPRLDGDDGEKPDAESEVFFCAAREGELSGYPKIWGLGEAAIIHETCLGKGDEACTYVVKWELPKAGSTRIVGAVAAGVVLGGAMGALGGIAAGVVGGVLGAALGGGAGFLYDRSRSDQGSRVFEKNRIAALERGLELKGETQAPVAVPGELTGTVLGGKYKIGRKIGSGGIGVVYVAEHTTLGHEVAVKVLRGAAARDGGEIARLRREAHIQADLEHLNIARVMDLDQMPDGSMYVVMERLIGRSLADKLARETVVGSGFAIPVFIGVCRALYAAHKKGVVHRDLKPGNVFLCEDGTPKVLDFGMSKLTTAESLTQAGYTLGTPEYMAPEQCIGANVVPQTDLYALGVLMYEALTGELPISSQNRRELLDLHQRQVPMPMRQRRPDLNLPEALDAVVMKCLKKKIADRPKTAEEVEQMLAAIPLEGLPLTVAARPRRSSAPPPAPLPEARTPAPPKEQTETLPHLQSDPPPK
jgi:serine/threonine-protein kinase